MVATKRTSNPSAQVVLLLLSQNSASCALKASGSRAWMTGRATAGHLADLDTLPYQCDPLIYAKTLAAPGLCFWCIGNEDLSSTVRMQQFLDKASWQSLIVDNHLAESTNCKVPTCPHPRCSDSFKTFENRDFHFQDVHCWTPVKPKTGVKRRRSCPEKAEEDRLEENEEKPRKRRCGTVRRIARPGEFVFVEQNGLFGKLGFGLTFTSS